MKFKLVVLKLLLVIIDILVDDARYNVNNEHKQLRADIVIEAKQLAKNYENEMKEL